jgi:hypothetical protein
MITSANAKRQALFVEPFTIATYLNLAEEPTHAAAICQSVKGAGKLQQLPGMPRLFTVQTNCHKAHRFEHVQWRDDLIRTDSKQAFTLNKTFEVHPLPDSQPYARMSEPVLRRGDFDEDY